MCPSCSGQLFPFLVAPLLNIVWGFSTLGCAGFDLLTAVPRRIIPLIMLLGTCIVL